jgi:hypothetical protein
MRLPRGLLALIHSNPRALAMASNA